MGTVKYATKLDVDNVNSLALKNAACNVQQDEFIEKNQTDISFNRSLIKTNTDNIKSNSDRIAALEGQGGGELNIDLSEYCKKTEVEDKINEEIDRREYISDAAVDGKLSEYYTKTESDRIFLKKSEATSGGQEVNLEDYVKSDELEPYAKKTDLTGYTTMTAVEQKLAEYALQSSLDSKVTEITTSIEKCATKEEIKDFITKDEVQTTYLTETDADSRYLKQGSDGAVDLTDYVKNEDIGEFVRQSDLDAKNYATNDDVDQKLENYSKTNEIVNTYALKEDVSKCLTSEDAEKTYVRQGSFEIPSLDGYVQSSTLDDYATKEEIGNFVTNSELDGKEYITQTQLDNEINSVKDELNGKFAEKADLSEYAKSSDVQAKYITQNEYNLDRLAKEAAIKAKLSKDEADSLYVKIGEGQTPPSEEVDLSEYAKTADMHSYVDGELENYVTTSHLVATLGDYMKTADAPSFELVSGNENIEISKNDEGKFEIKIKYI